MADKTRDVSSRNGVAQLRRRQRKAGPSSPSSTHRPRKCPHPDTQAPTRAPPRPQAAPLSPSTRQARPRPGHGDLRPRASQRSAQSCTADRTAPRPTSGRLTKTEVTSHALPASARRSRESHFIARAACQSRPPRPQGPAPSVSGSAPREPSMESLLGSRVAGGRNTVRPWPLEHH